MCGFCGSITPNKYSEEELKHTVSDMYKELLHRGPDDHGSWVDAKNGIALGHTRLSILDLSEHGSQPMQSTNGRWVISYNGEIYNHLAIRKEINHLTKNRKWNGNCDTETLAEAISIWGIEKTLRKINGMFGFAAWDRQEKILYIARDRIGEKPVYYGKSGNTFLFGSELKALRKHPNWKSDIDFDAVTLFLSHGYIPSPWSIYKNISKLPPAHFVCVSNHGNTIHKPKAYWEIPNQFDTHSNDNGRLNSPQEWITSLETLLDESIKLRMIADVNVGAFISGGIDSSLVASLAQKQNQKPLDTFSVGFENDAFNEAIYAKNIAKYLGTNHSEIYISDSEARAVIPKLPQIWDEPFADSSQIPTYLISEFASKSVKVVLSGDGGDELFYGYPRYINANQSWKIVNKVPKFARGIPYKLFQKIPDNKVPSLAMKRWSRFKRMAYMLNTETPDQFYYKKISHHEDPKTLLTTMVSGYNLDDEVGIWGTSTDSRKRITHFDTKVYLPDDILTKVDRASMAVGLESRIPMLDHNLLEFAWGMPDEIRLNHIEPKMALKSILRKYLPVEMWDRPKMGFGIPLNDWLKGPLKEWADDLLEPNNLNADGYFNTEIVKKLWDEHKKGENQWGPQLWDLLMFQSWKNSI